MFTSEKSLLSEKGTYYKQACVDPESFVNGVQLNSEYIFFMIRSTTNLKHTFRGFNCIQNYHLGRYMVRYTVINLFLRRLVSGAVKRDF